MRCPEADSASGFVRVTQRNLLISLRQRVAHRSRNDASAWIAKLPLVFAAANSFDGSQLP
jgi:hypothetical protein